MDPQILKSIQNYKVLYEKDPNSRVFAPLAECHRRLKNFHEATRLCREGISKHSDFAGGYLCLGRVLVDQGEYEEALQHLEMTVHLASDNILAHTLIAEVQLYLKKPDEALAAYENVLSLNPENEKITAIIHKLNSLSSSEKQKLIEPVDEELSPSAPQASPILLKKIDLLKRLQDRVQARRLPVVAKHF